MLLLAPLFVSAQQVNFDKVVLPPENKAREFEEYLVQMAWQNNPSNKILDYTKTMAEKEVILAKQAWMNDVTAAFNLNEASIFNLLETRDERADNFIAFPLYSVGVRVSLGTFMNNPREREIAEAEVQIAEAEINQRKLRIRAETLKRYRTYLVGQEILKTRLQSEEDAKSTYELVKELFAVNKATFEEYTQTSQTFYQAKELRQTAEFEVEVAKILLEEMTGLPWETLERYKKLMDKQKK